MSIGKLLESKRTTLKIPMKDVQAALGVDRQEVRQIETGERPPTDREMRVLGKLYNLTEDDLDATFEGGADLKAYLLVLPSGECGYWDGRHTAHSVWVRLAAGERRAYLSRTIQAVDAGDLIPLDTL